MKELSRILNAYTAPEGQGMVLATIVKTVGSSYRRPGARMLILPDGRTIGSVSGGCLERDVIAHAEKVRVTGESIVLTYDTTSEEDVVLGVGLGCKGVIDILVEPLNGRGTREGADGMLSFLDGIFRARRSAVVATLFRVEGAVKGRVGDRLTLDDGSATSEIQEERLNANVRADAREAARTNRPATKRYDYEDGAAEVFIEAIHAPAALFIFGAGYDALPMSRLAQELGFHVTVVDRRPAYATKERFPEADAVVLLRAEDAGNLDLNARSAVIVMAHHYVTDQAHLKVLLPIPLRYLGMMGPRRRTQKMLEEFRAEGIIFDDALFQKLHNPVGLDIGAESPEQIALAVLSEIQAVFSGHTGGSLRGKKGPIHARCLET